MAARTEEHMRWLLKDRLLPGKTVKVERWATQSAKAGGYIFRGSRKGVVVALYPHIFTVRFGNILESFRYTQFFVKDTERVKL